MNLLLLSRSEKWSNAAHAAVERAGSGVMDEARSAREAINRLVGRPNRYSHLLVDPHSAGVFMPDLVGLTIGEAATGTGLVLLGERSGAPPNAAVVAEPDDDSLSQALALRTPRRSPAPTLAREEMRDALVSGLIDARFQPIVRVADRQPTGMEALARLRHPAWGVMSPDAFVPQIERAGLSRELTDAIARSAFKSLPAAVTMRHDLFLTLNLPLDVVLIPDALSDIEARRAKSGLSADRVLIELTESRPVEDVSSLGNAVALWRDAGYQLAIDDAGPDIANLRALYRLPFTTVKLDKNIVQHAGSNPHALMYVDRTVRLAHGYGMQVIAEGVETRADWDRMASMGVDQVQGFYVARPLPARAVPVWLEAWIRHQLPVPDQTAA